MLKKNQQVQIEITGLNSEGAGVGRHEGFAIFVPMTAPGDIVIVKLVKVLKNYGFGIIHDYVKKSENRVKNDCDVYIKCGGCSYRHINYKTELEQKKSEVEFNFKKIGHMDIVCEDILSANSERYRNKAQFPVALSEDGKSVITGFYAQRTHRVIKCEDCLLQPDVFSEVVADVTFFAEKYSIKPYDETKCEGLLRHIFLRRGDKTGEIMLCLVVTSFDFPHKDILCRGLSKKYPQLKSIILCKNDKNTNVIMGDETKVIFGDDYITDELCGLKFKISALSFYQVNRTMAEKLYKTAEEFAQLKGDEVLLDMYCGAGTIGLSMAKQVKKLIGVEIVSKAVEDAKHNALENGISNAEFICMDATRAAEKLLSEGAKPDVVIVDPPRQGCDNACLDAIVKMNPEKIVMISCNSATAARDCAFLCENGFEIKRLKAADLFPRTTHVECCIQLCRK